MTFLSYQQSFWRDTSGNSADNLPPGGETKPITLLISTLFCAELAAALSIIGEVEGGELYWPHIFDPERTAFPLGLLIVQVADIHLCPDPTHQQSIVLADIVLWNMDIFMTEIREFGPVFVVLREIAYSVSLG